MKTKGIVPILLCLAVLLPELADADKLVHKSRERKYPFGWCPLVSEDVLLFQFKATSSSATIRLVADKRPGQRIDNIYVVEKSVFEENLVNDDTCDNGSTFDPLSGNALFVETFDSEANGWKLNGSSWALGSAPEAENSGALHLNPNGLGGVIVAGLKKGLTYVVGGWWYTDIDNTEGAILTLKVDTKGQLGCGSDKSVAGASNVLAWEDEEEEE